MVRILRKLHFGCERDGDTLTDEEVQAAMDKVTHVCAQKHGATVRA